MTRALGYKLPIQVLGPNSYRVYEDMPYHSPRYAKSVMVRADFRCDGATGAMDILTRAWVFHDWFCSGGAWMDGSTPTRWESSAVLYDQLREDGYWFRAPFWRLATWLRNPMQGVTARPSPPPAGPRPASGSTGSARH